MISFGLPRFSHRQHDQRPGHGVRHHWLAGTVTLKSGKRVAGTVGASYAISAPLAPMSSIGGPSTGHPIGAGTYY